MENLAQLPQLFVYGIISGSIITLGAIGLSLTYRILNFANFAHGDMMSVGAYIALASLMLFTRLGFADKPFQPLSFGLGMTLSLLIAMLLSAGIAILIDKILYQRLRRGGAVILLIASLGVALLLRNVILLLAGPQPREYSEAIQISREISGIRIKPDQIFIIALALVLVFLLHIFLQKTRIGKAMRAAADNMDLARVSGIDTKRVILWTWGIGAALAAAGGILLGIDTQLQPDMGWNVLLSVFAAVILGGIGNPYGAMAGGFVIGLSEEVSTMFIPTSYKPAVAFGLMVIMLLIRPTGLFGAAKTGV